MANTGIDVSESMSLSNIQVFSNVWRINID